jgi:molybdenum cofactor guanylyltransferase
MSDNQTKITGVVLAGGLARRMGGTDKGLIQLKGRPLISYAIDAILSVTDRALINANRNHEAYRALGYPVVSDRTSTFDGPLAGILSAMQTVETPYILTLPCDCPLFEGEHLQRMVDTMDAEKMDCCTAFDGRRLHPVFLLLDCRLSASLDAYLSTGQRKIDTWLNQHRLGLVDYSDQPEIFRNVNTQEDLAVVESAL